MGCRCENPHPFDTPTNKLKMKSKCKQMQYFVENMKAKLPEL